MKAKQIYIRPKVSIILVESENCFDKTSTYHQKRKKTGEL